MDALRRAHALELAARGAVADTRIALSTALAATGGRQRPDDAVRARCGRACRRRPATDAEQPSGRGGARDGGGGRDVGGSRRRAVRRAPRARRRRWGTPEPPTAAPVTAPPGARHRGPDVETGGDREAGPTETHSATGAGSGDGAGAPAADGSAPMAGRRRGRSREDVGPGPLLAEALSAGSLDAFSTAPARPTDTAPDGSPEPPVATGPDPVEHPAAGMLAELLAGEEDADRFPAYPVLDGLDVSSDPLGLGPGILDGLDDQGQDRGPRGPRRRRPRGARPHPAPRHHEQRHHARPPRPRGGR